jgi:hypothetical protein
MVLIRTRDSRAHMEMAKADAGGSEADHAEAAPVGA